MIDPIIGWLWQNAEKISIVFLVLFCGLALFMGWVITKREADRRDKMWQERYDKAVKDCEFQTEMVTRLLEKLERTVTVTEVAVKKAKRET